MLIVILGGLFLPYVFISQYAVPYSDDFVFGFRGREFDRLQQGLNEYFSWSGRYTSNILYFINPISFNSFTGYKLLPIVWIFLTGAAWFLFIHALIGKSVSRTNQLIIALFLALLYFHQAPILSEGIYWYTGAVTYQLGNISLLVYISILAFVLQERFYFKNKFIQLFILTAVVILCIGFNEIQLIALLLFASISAFLVAKNKLANKSLFIYLLLITFVFSGVMLFAPGNAARGSFAANTHKFFPSLLFSIAQTVRFFLEWTSSLPLLLLSVLYYGLNKKIVEKNHLFASSFYLLPRFSISFLFLIIFISVFPPYWATGILGQHRTLNVAYSLFIILWFINLTVCFNFYSKELERIGAVQKNVHIGILILIICGLGFSRNGYDVITDIFYGKARNYEAKMTERYKLLKTTSDTVYFDPIHDPPKTLFLYEVSTDPTYWVNKCYNVYFELGDKKIIKQKE